MNINIRVLLLMPFTVIYRIIIFMRNLLFDWKILPSRGFDIPIISVGNIAVGGTGKTPHIEYLIRFLTKDYRVAVLSRGYKRKTSGFILANHRSAVPEIGDEACQVKRKFPDVIVAVDEKRTRGIQELLNMEDGPDIILLDDAFQHRYVKPGLSLLLDDFSRPAKKDYLLPAGRLREPFASKKRADIILVTKSPGDIKPGDRQRRIEETAPSRYQHVYFTRMIPGAISGIFNGHFQQTTAEMKPAVLLVSGIAHPSTIKPMVQNVGTRIQELIFRDHHEYTETDANKILREFLGMEQENAIILTTEKDAVKLKDFEHIFQPIKEKMFYFPIFVEFLNNDDTIFKLQLLNYVNQNKRNRFLHKT